MRQRADVQCYKHYAFELALVVNKAILEIAIDPFHMGRTLAAEDEREVRLESSRRSGAPPQSSASVLGMLISRLRRGKRDSAQSTVFSTTITSSVITSAAWP